MLYRRLKLPCKPTECTLRYEPYKKLKPAGFRKDFKALLSLDNLGLDSPGRRSARFATATRRIAVCEAAGEGGMKNRERAGYDALRS